MSITALPQPPTRSDPVNFNSRADAFLSALPTFATEANELQADVNAKQIAAAASAANALASENAANAASGATLWVSGTTYAVGNVRYSPITFLSYRRKTAGAGTTDPSADSTNWQLINGTGNVDLNSTQTLTNKTFSTGSNWNGNAVPITNGGTGQTTAANAFNALKQNATETATGVVELATTTEAAGGTAIDVVVTPAGLSAGIDSLVNKSLVLNRISQTNHTDIGSITVAWNATTNNVASNGTIAGSDLRYTNDAVSSQNAPADVFQPITNNANSGSSTFPIGGTTTLSGTWRNIGPYCRGRYSFGIDPTISVWYPSLWLRIA